MPGLTVADQIAQMRERFPALRPTLHCSWWVTWIGPVRPLHAEHTIRVGYVRRYWLGDLENHQRVYSGSDISAAGTKSGASGHRESGAACVLARRLSRALKALPLRSRGIAMVTG